MDMIEQSRRVYKGFVKHATSPDVALIKAAHKSNTSSRLQGPRLHDHPGKSPALISA
jgi:hypothetical protein